jgi:hypothetical protein
MDRILSARIDEKVAILLDVLKVTWGAWNRRESAEATVRKA